VNDIEPPPSIVDLVTENLDADRIWKQWLYRLFEYIQVEDWHEVGATGEIAFENSWANRASGNDATAAFYKDPFNVVWIGGVIDTGASGTVAFTLPSEYRPSNDVEFPVLQVGLTSAGSVKIDTSGQATVTYGVGATAVHLSNIHFRV
jgi:hypothetical protein